MTENTLFYSKYCKYCLTFIKQLKINGLLDYFPKKVCIDNPHFRKNPPPFLKEVPTIIVDDYDKPISSDIAFKWITYKVKEMNKPKQQKGSNNQQKTCSISDPQCYSFDNSFDNFGSLETGNAYGGLGDASSLKKGGKGSTGSINYESFMLIDPSKAGKKGSTGSIDYDSFNLGGGNMQNNQVQSGDSNSDFDKRLEKMQKMRSMDNDLYGNGGTVRQG